MMYMARRLTSYFIKKGLVSEKEREIYEYGFDITLYTILSTAGLLLAGLLLRQLLAAAILVAIFYTCQSNGGGYHASTHLNCFLVMLSGLLAGLALSFFPVPAPVLYGFGALSFAALYAVPLVLHPNKQYLEGDRPRLTRRSYLATTALLAACLLLIFVLRLPPAPFAAGVALSAVSRLAAKIIDCRRRAA